MPIHPAEQPRPSRSLPYWLDRAALREHAAVLGLYLLGTLYVMAGVLPFFNSAIPGALVAQEDGWINTWNLWWVYRALTSGQNPFYSDMIFYPTGASLHLHVLSFTNGVLTLPIQAFFGPIVAYNSAAIIGFVLTGYAAYLLARHLLHHHGIACVVGALVTFSPFHISKLWDGHLSWVSLQWPLLYMLCLLLALEQQQWRWRGLAGLLLAVAALTSWYYALFGLIFTALLALVRLPTVVRTGRWRSELLTYMVTGAISALLVSPVLLPTLLQYISGEYPGGRTISADWNEGTPFYSADLVDPFFPSFLHPVLGQMAFSTHDQMRPLVWFWTISPGYGVLALALLGGWYAWRQVRGWVVIIAVLLVLMLGPTLYVGGTNTGLTMPYDLLKYVPGMALGHRPNHLVIFVLPLVAVLAGHALRGLLAHGRRGRVVLALYGLLIAYEYALLPLPVMHYDAPPVFADLRGQPGALLELPPDERSAFAMKHQLTHQRPILGGTLSRQSERPPLVRSLPWLSEMWRMYPTYQPDIVSYRSGDGWQAFSAYGIRTVVVRHTDLLPVQERDIPRVIQHVLPGIAPSEQHPGITVYQVPPVATPRPFLYLGAGWQDYEQRGDYGWRWMAEAAEVQIVNPDTRAHPVRLTLTAEGYQEPRPLRLHLAGHAAGTFEIPAAARRTLRLHLLLPPGEHTLHLSSEASPEQTAPYRTLSLSFTRIHIAPTR